MWSSKRFARWSRSNNIDVEKSLACFKQAAADNSGDVRGVAGMRGPAFNQLDRVRGKVMSAAITH